ncbi:ATP-dependent helicase [Funiculus sociatus GB2-A5]|uniref:DNA 3'-5' helicase n=2 Tax=Cyanobacteriota TaxID=1117 RepID=A0ABV0JI38_9CYAN|nr:ATP-dependent helicase [Microcoleus sp. FACHB-831]MBD1922208.1 ATP-dependent helicase [Microcoleus sp. FACHB-831]MBD2065626.1 ATP-dependent helicase [Trichocoleus sp. FACHB-6]
MLSESEQHQLLEKLRTLHSDDEKQLEVIFSESKRLIVEAPAGYGKTKTMISKVAYLLATGQIAHPKKILTLTFSVNAAYKIKKELSEHLPHLIQPINSNQFRVNERLFVSNYHGFCRHILKKYGYLLHSNLSNIEILKSVDDSESQEITALLDISYDKASIFTEYSDAVKSVDKQHVLKFFNRYTDGIIESFLDKDYISFNGILALTLRLFQDYSEVLHFYQGYFPMIIVDEFQDTNVLSWALLKKLVADRSQLVFIGDSLQRIYGFIGAIPNLMLEAEQLLSMDRIALEKNYRFMSNPQMLQLDKNIRLNAEKPDAPAIQIKAEVPFISVNNQLEESEKIAQKIISLISSEDRQLCKVAILVKQRGENVNKIIEVLMEKNISYFYALFGDDDSEYLSFHRECSSQFTEQLRKDIRISKGTLSKFYIKIAETFKHSSSPVIKSLLNLLEVFLSRALSDYSFLSAEDKLILIRDTFENRTLKQNMEYVNENVIISTIHGAKGLEWDYVLMPDMEQYSMPNWNGLCGACNHKSNCNLTVDSRNEKNFLEELSVFYVGVTRARKQIVFSASKTRFKADGTTQPANLSCMLKLPGIAVVEQ